MPVNEGEVLISSVQDLIFEKIKHLNGPKLYWGSLHRQQSDVWLLYIWEIDLKGGSEVKHIIKCRTSERGLIPGFEVYRQGSDMRPDSALFVSFFISKTSDFVVKKLRTKLYRRRQKLQTTK